MSEKAFYALAGKAMGTLDVTREIIAGRDFYRVFVPNVVNENDALWVGTEQPHLFREIPAGASVILDFTNVTLANSATFPLPFVFRAGPEGAWRNVAKVYLVNVSAAVKYRYRLHNLDRIFPIYATFEAFQADVALNRDGFPCFYGQNALGNALVENPLSALIAD